MSYDRRGGELSVDQGVVIAPTLKASPEQLSVELLGEHARFSLRMRGAHVPAFNRETGLALPQGVGKTRETAGARILCLGPDEWLIVAAPELKDDMESRCAGGRHAPYSLVDISHRNVAFRIAGAQAARVINIGCPLDLGLKAFPPGKCARTVFERAEIILARDGETQFYIEMWRSFAPYVVSIIER